MLFILKTVRDRVISIKVWTGWDVENLAIVPWKTFEFSEIHPLCLNFGRKLRKWFFWKTELFKQILTCLLLETLGMLLLSAILNFAGNQNYRFLQSCLNFGLVWQ